MAVISYTKAKVRPLPGAIVRRYNAGGSLEPGKAVYVDTAGAVQAAINSAATAGRGRGIVVSDRDGDTSFTSGDRVDVVVLGPVAGYSSMSEGVPYYVAASAGKITATKPGSGTQQFVLGYAESTSVFFVMPQATAPTTA